MCSQQVRDVRQPLEGHARGRRTGRLKGTRRTPTEGCGPPWQAPERLCCESGRPLHGHRRLQQGTHSQHSTLGQVKVTHPPPKQHFIIPARSSGQFVFVWLTLWLSITTLLNGMRFLIPPLRSHSFSLDSTKMDSGRCSFVHSVSLKTEWLLYKMAIQPVHLSDYNMSICAPCTKTLN